MDYVLKQMECSVILSSEDIARFKGYIKQKYADFTSAYRAGVLADSLYRAVDPHLEGVANVHRDPLKRSLFENTLAKNINQIRKKDIFTEIVALKIPEDEINANALRWVNKNVAPESTLSDIKKYVQQVRTPDPSEDIIANVLAEIQAEIEAEKEARQEIELAARKSLGISVSKTKNKVLTESINESAKVRPITPKLIKESRVLVKKEIEWKLPEVKVNIDFSKARNLFMNSTQAVLEYGTEIIMKRNTKAFRRVLVTTCLGLSIAVLSLTWGADFIGVRMQQAAAQEDFTEVTAALPQVGIEEEVPVLSVFAYEKFDEKKLRDQLVKNNSLLADSPYFETIVKTAKKHGIDPRLLFAIAGQEQGLVRKDNVNAEKIANNPFNVYGSWQSYNTNIADSAHIVCNTLVRRLGMMPTDEDPLVWINKKYAEDKNWNIGVRAYYEKLNEISDISDIAK